MMAVTRTCITPTDLAAFLEGSLTGDERDRMVRHLNHCLDCFERYIGAARLLDAIEEEEASTFSAADINVVAQNSSNYQNRLSGKLRLFSAEGGLPHRHIEGEEVLQAQFSLEKTRESSEKRRLLQGLQEAVATLSPEDQLILRLRMQDQISIAHIARTLNLEQKPLYRRLERIYASLRSALESKGVRAEDIKNIIGDLEHESNKPGK